MPTINSPTPDATTTSKGKIQLAGALAGTAAAPSIASGVSLAGPIVTDAAVLNGQTGSPATPNTGTAKLYAVGSSGQTLRFKNDGGTEQTVLTNISSAIVYLGSATTTTGFSTTSTSPVQYTGLSVTVTVPTGGRNVKVSLSGKNLGNHTGGQVAILTLWDGTVGTGTQLATAQTYTTNADNQAPVSVFTVYAPSSGSHTYNVGLTSGSGGNAFMEAGAGAPVTLLVEGI